jgi:hypothetical protein
MSFVSKRALACFLASIFVLVSASFTPAFAVYYYKGTVSPKCESIPGSKNVRITGYIGTNGPVVMTFTFVPLSGGTSFSVVGTTSWNATYSTYVSYLAVPPGSYNVFTGNTSPPGTPINYNDPLYQGGKFDIVASDCQFSSLTVQKTLEIPRGMNSPVSSYPVYVKCDTNSQLVQLSGANQFQYTVPNLAPPSNCSIAEGVLLTPVGCVWERTYPLGQTFTVPTAHSTAARLEIHNKLFCKARGGSISVNKVVVSDPENPPPPMDFLVDVHCPGVPDVTLHLNQENSFSDSVPDLANGTVCTIVEHPLPACHWETTYPQGQSARIDNRISLMRTVENKWVCQ